MIRPIHQILLLLAVVFPVAGAPGGEFSSAFGFLDAPDVSHVALRADGEQALWVTRREGDAVVRQGAPDAIGSTTGTARIRLGAWWPRTVGWQGDRWMVHADDGFGRHRVWIGASEVGVPVRLAADIEAVRAFEILGRAPGGGWLLSHDRRQAHEPDVYRIDPGNNALERVARNPGRVFEWIGDAEGRLRLARRWSPAGSGIRYELLYRSSDAAAFRSLAAHDLDQPVIRPLGFTPDGARLYVEREGGAGEVGLHYLDPVSGTLGEPVLRWASGQVRWLRHEPHSGRLALVALDGERPSRVALEGRGVPDPARALYPDQRVTELGADSRGRELWRVTGPGEPGLYVWVDESGGRRVQARALPGHTPEPAPVTAIRWRARDGLPLTGYLTRGGNEPGPLVVRVHGGPWSRDAWRFDSEVQFLAALGYSVLQVNYRGSSGLGHHHLMAGQWAWGKAMQDDLVDGVRHAAEIGLIDSSRVCVMGASYGGYATLMAMIEQSKTFRCGVAHAPVTDLSAQIRGYRASGNRQAALEWRVMVGEPGSQGLESVSPLNRASALDGPLLLSHGALDTDVPVEHSRRFAAAAPARHLDYREYPAAGHTLRDRDTRLAYYQAVARFLERHLGEP